MLLWVAAVTAIAGVGGTGIGGLLSACFRKDSDRIVSLLLSFASGVMLSVVCMDLIPESIQEGKSSGLWLTIAGILIGFAVIFLLNHIIDKKTNHEIPHIDPGHPKTADGLDELIHFDHYEEHRKSRRNLFIAGVVMACAIALHNLPEGMVIGAAYAAAPAEDAFTGSGFIMAVIIGLHNIPEGMSVAVPLISGGMRRWKAVLITALSGAPTILGALLGYGIGVMGPVALCLSLSFASGAMLYVVFGELLPEAILMWRSKLPAFAAVIGMLAGLLIIFGG
ncbi:MAG: ZIP family metal transporter [Oscillospiraceae bacterium]|nr:ZIP family metal transporter [Oscillospiraceae bacterium]